MIIGIPKETKDQEHRVAVTPEAVGQLVQSGHRVLIEQSAGRGSGFTDEAFQASGAVVLPDRASLYDESNLILKVKEPQSDEYGLLKEGQILFSFLHLASNRELTNVLRERGVIAIASETVQGTQGVLPILRPMSQIAGRMSILVGAYYLQKVHGGSGVLLPGVPGVSPARVVILGGGSVGMNAARMAVGLGGQVTLFHQENERMRYLDELFQGQITTRISHQELLEQSLLSADLVVGAVSLVGARTPKLVSRELVASMKKGSVIVDVAIDQGGCIETSHPTTHSDPIFHEHDIIHYCVSNMPGAYPRTATQALINESLPFIMKIVELGLEAACHEDESLAAGLNLFNGKVTHRAVAEAHDFKYESFDKCGA